MFIDILSEAISMLTNTIEQKHCVYWHSDQKQWTNIVFIDILTEAINMLTKTIEKATCLLTFWSKAMQSMVFINILTVAINMSTKQLKKHCVYWHFDGGD